MKYYYNTSFTPILFNIRLNSGRKTTHYKYNKRVNIYLIDTIYVDYVA